MAIFIDGKKIAGRGTDGSSPYEIAVRNGFSGSEIEFNNALGKLNTAATQAENAATRAETASAIAETVQNNLTSYPTRTEVNNLISQGVATVDTGVWFYGPEAPSNTNLLWIDSNLIDGGLKFYVNGAWTHVPVAWK